MRQNNNNGPRRPVLVEKKQSKPHHLYENGRTADRRQTINERSSINQASNRALKMANTHRNQPTIQERAHEHRLQEQELYGEAMQAKKPRLINHSVNAATKTGKIQKKKTTKKQPSLFEKIFPKDKEIKGPPDYLIMEIVGVLLAIGLVMVFSASSYRSLLEYGSAFSYFIRQAVFAVVGLAAALVIMMLSPNVFRKCAMPLLACALLLLIFTLFNGEESLGATRWITIAGVRFTPSELAKPLMVICVADLIKDSPYDVVKNKSTVATFVLILVTFAVIAVEDLGSAGAIFFGCFAIFVVAGLSKRWILTVFGVGIAVFCVYVALEPYRFQRLIGFLSQTDASAADGSAYQLVQSLYAFGSGGLFGVGLGNSGQKLLYLPGMHTDFIYSVIGEELGIAGALLVLGLFIALAWRGLWIAMRINDPFKSYLAFGATAIITAQALINMAVAVGVCPVTGITLPFISYGGTSLIVSLVLVGLLLNMSRYADKSKKKRPTKSSEHMIEQ